MNTGNKDVRTETRLPGQEADLRWRLEEAEQTLEAIRHGEVDAIIVAGPRGDLVYSLTGAEHAYRVIVETMNEAALTADLEGTILFCNQRFCDLMRTPMHEVVGRKVVDFVAEPQRPALEKAMTEAQAGPVRQHLALRDSAGKAVPVLLSVSLLQTTESVSLCLVASDLTELEESANSIRVLREHEQALQESEERYRRFFMDDLTGDFTATPEGAILECNPAFAEIYGFESPAEAAAMGDVSRFNSEDWMMLMAAVREQGRVRRYEGRHRSFDGRDIYVVANVIGRFNEAGELTGVRGYVFDDTDRKLAEMVLHEANARLEDQRENLLVANEQLLTQQEELQRQAEELRHANLMLKELKEQAEEAAGKMEWLGRIPQEDPNPVFRVSLASRILYRNAAAQELCRVWNCEQAMPQGVRELIVTAQARAGPVTQELTVGDRTYLLNIAPFVADGYINLYVQDITERKNVEEALSRSETLLRTVLDNSPDAVFMKDREGRLVLANPATLAIVGKPAEAAIGKTDAELYDNPADALAIMENDRRIMNSGQVEAVEECVSDPAGTRTYLSTKAPYRDEEGRIVGLIGVTREITDRKRAEESLRELNATLETKVSQRTAELEFRARQLQKLALELSQAEEQERRRLAEILHDDLQQQLAAVKFHLGIVGSRAKGDFGVQRSITQLDKMLKDAIETSRNLSHELSPAVMYHGDLGEIIEWLANQIRIKHGLLVEVTSRGRIEVESDALKTFLYKAVQEMLFNAVKHAKVSRARVRLRRRNRYVSLCVSDRGRGFDPQDLKQTAGFGLMSVRERIELLGGRMRIHSVKGEGSRFVITVPDSQATEDGPQATADPVALSFQSPVPAHSLRVLIADDHEIVRHGLASLLGEAQDIDIVGEAGNGREAVDLAYQLRPDVVIMDVAMPLMNGDEAARQILRHLPATRIVALSMYDEAGVAEKMQRAGAEAYVLKTAPADEMLAAVRGKK